MADTKYPVGAYRLAAKAYIPRSPGAPSEVLEEGTEITHEGAPGAHMIPLDDAARDAVEIAKKDRRLGSLDPVSSLDVTMSADTRLELAMDEIARLRADIARLAGNVHMGGVAPMPPVPPLPAAPPPAPPPPPSLPMQPPPLPGAG